MLEGVERHPYEIETGFVDLGEVPPLEPPFARVGPIGIVTEHIDPALEWLVGGVEANRGRCGGRRCRGECEKCGDGANECVNKSHSGPLHLVRLVE
jgi:hypothetical protein